jgi:hypothetical protein
VRGLIIGGFKTMTNIQEDLQYLDELIRKVNDMLNPEDSLAYLQKKDIRDRLYGEKPGCFITLQKIGRDVSPYMLPMCNRYGMEDPKVIGISLKVVKRLIDSGNDSFDNNVLQKVLNSLQHRHDVLSKTVPKPATAAARKAKVTRMFGNIKQYLMLSKTGSM